MAFFSRPPGACGGRGQLGDQELESADLGFEFGDAKLFIRYGVLLEGLPAVVGGGLIPALRQAWLMFKPASRSAWKSRRIAAIWSGLGRFRMNRSLALCQLYDSH